MYMLIGDSGTVVFEKTGTVQGESVKLSSKVTSMPVEGSSSGDISDHASLDPIKFDITGEVSSAAEYNTLESMWRNRDLLLYRGIESFDNLVILTFTRNRSAANSEGYAFSISFQQITLASAVLVDIQRPTMYQMDSAAPKAPAVKKATASVKPKGTVPLSGLIKHNANNKVKIFAV